MSDLLGLVPVALSVLLSILVGRSLRATGERAFSSMMAGAFFGLFSWFFSVYFLGGWLFVVFGAFTDSLIKIAGVNLRKEKKYSLFFGLGFGLATSFLSLFYSNALWLYGIIFALVAVLFHSSTSVIAHSTEVFRPLPRLFLLSLLYNILLTLNSWESIIIAMVYGVILFHHQYRALRSAAE